MKNSIVYIESSDNRSFGTGFVVHSDNDGSYILTCQHVIDSVVNPIVGDTVADIITPSSFIDMAVLFVKGLELQPLPLQIDGCDSLEVEVIGFSSFDKSSSQKEHIDATLYSHPIERHLHEENLSYQLRKIKAHNDFTFSKGNSGSPVICKSTRKIIAMVSNRKGGETAYAIEISTLEKVWREIPSELFSEEENISGVKEHQTAFVSHKKRKISPFIKYGIPLLLVGVLLYIFVSPYIVARSELKSYYTLIKKLPHRHDLGKTQSAGKLFVQKNASVWADNLENRVEDRYLRVQDKILKYRIVSLAYLFAGLDAEIKEERVRFAKKAIEVSDIALGYINGLKADRVKQKDAYEWMGAEHMEDKTVYIQLVASALLSNLLKDREFIEKTLELFKQNESWYTNKNFLNRSDEVEIFLKDHHHQSQKDSSSASSSGGNPTS